MIQVTRLNGDEITVNAIYIESVEAKPDTLLSFTNGNRMIVRESVDEVVQLIRNYMQSIGLLRAAVKMGEEVDSDD